MFDGAPPGELIETAPPRVTLRNAFAHPFDSAIAAARTCYAPRLIGPEEITDKQRLNIGAATFYSGHHTVYQHAHFEFGLENVSRQFVWSFLHAHPFYNSEQQSQRYVRLTHALAYLPPESPGFGAAERAIEVARYVLPVAAATTMVHTLSGIVLHRLCRMAAASDTPAEARAVIGEMVARVREIDPQFFDRFGNAPMEQEEMPEWSHASIESGHAAGATALDNAVCPETRGVHPEPRGEAFAREFDARLAGRVSVLTDFSTQAPRVVAEAYRAVLGLPESACSDAEAIDRLLNPARNTYRLETLNVGVHAPIMRALQHANFTFAKKISHTADSQDQRHRMVPGSRPLLVLTDTRAPDFFTPMLIAGNSRAREVYERAMADAWSAKNELLDRGVPREIALYLLPNAKAIRLVESGSLLHLLHKWTMRTCFNAQEEIYQASMEEVEQVRAALPALGRYLGPPCYIRAGVASPICTEGSHFCGVKVWQEFPKIERRI